MTCDPYRLFGIDLIFFVVKYDVNIDHTLPIRVCLWIYDDIKDFAAVDFIPNHF